MFWNPYLFLPMTRNKMRSQLDPIRKCSGSSYKGGNRFSNFQKADVFCDLKAQVCFTNNNIQY